MNKRLTRKDANFPDRERLAQADSSAVLATENKYLVVGLDIGRGQRYADYFFSSGPDEAKELAHREVEETGGGLLVAAVILGDRIVA